MCMLDASEERERIAIPRRIRQPRLVAPFFRPKYEEFRLAFRRRPRGGSRSEKLPAGGLERVAEQVLEAVREQQRNTSIWRKTKWDPWDEDKMKNLVGDLAELANSPRALTVHVVDQGKERQIATQTVSDIYNVETLKHIQEASADMSPFCRSISERIQRLESPASGATAFYSAKSRPGGLLDPEWAHGTNLHPRDSFVRGRWP